MPAKRMPTTARRSQYDGGVSQFDPDGTLHQVEYATVAVRNSEPAAALLLRGGVVLAARVRSFLPDALRAGPYFEKIVAIDDHLVCAVAGVGPDATALVAAAREAAQTHHLAWGDPIPPQLLARAVCNQCQAYTQFGGLRPFGASLLVAGYDASDGFQLISIDPSGNYHTHHAKVLGSSGSEGCAAAVAAVGKGDVRIRRAVVAALRSGPGAVADAAFGELAYGQQVLEQALGAPTRPAGEAASEHPGAEGASEETHLEVAILTLREVTEERASGETTTRRYPVIVFGPGPGPKRAPELKSCLPPEAELTEL
jgi:20S proteasome subunit alpha 3